MGAGQATITPHSDTQGVGVCYDNLAAQCRLLLTYPSLSMAQSHSTPSAVMNTREIHLEL